MLPPLLPKSPLLTLHTINVSQRSGDRDRGGPRDNRFGGGGGGAGGSGRWERDDRYRGASQAEQSGHRQPAGSDYDRGDRRWNSYDRDRAASGGSFRERGDSGDGGGAYRPPASGYRSNSMDRGDDSNRQGGASRGRSSSRGEAADPDEPSVTPGKVVKEVVVVGGVGVKKSKKDAEVDKVQLEILRQREANEVNQHLHTRSLTRTTPHAHLHTHTRTPPGPEAHGA